LYFVQSFVLCTVRATQPNWHFSSVQFSSVATYTPLQERTRCPQHSSTSPRYSRLAVQSCLRPVS